MKFLTNFFRKNKNEEQVQELIPQDQFIDAVPPFETETSLLAPEVKSDYRITIIKDYLDKDYFQLGYEDSILYPVQERKNSALKRLRADYRHVLQQAQQMLKSTIACHAQQVLSLQGVSNVLDDQLAMRTKDLELLYESLEEQQILSLDDEGWLAPVIAAYEEGFQVGALEYARTNNLIGDIRFV